MDELTGRRVPYSAEAEQAILGAMLFESACIPDVVNHVRTDEFYIETNREIFETIFAMFGMGRKIDVVTVPEEMKQRGYWKETTQRYLIELMEVTPTAANVLAYCTIVRENAILRNLGSAATEISELVYGGAAEAQQALELAEKKIYALRKDNTAGGLQPMNEVLQDVIANISAAATEGRRLPGLTTGLADIDDRLMGMQGGDFLLIASRPGMGKTSIALNMAVSAAKASRKTVAIFSLEMSRQQLVMRLLSSESHINHQQLVQGRISPEEWSRLAEAAGTLSQLDIRIDDNPSMTVAELDRKAGPRHGGLSPAHAERRERTLLVEREPHPGGERYQPHDEGHRKGARRASRVPEPAQPREREPDEQAADAFRPARIRRDRAGRRCGHRPVPGRVL